MLRGIIRSSLSFRFLVLVLAGVIIAVGITQLPSMPVDVLPEFSPPFVEIQTEALGLSSEEVEQMITVPMEQDLLAGVAWLDVIRSESVPGLSSILIYFEPGTDLYKARQMVSERLAQAAVGIPHVSKPPAMIQPTSSVSRFMIVGMSSSQLSLIEMSVLARWTIAPRLLGVSGVANVAIWGNRDRQLQVLVDPQRLKDAGISLEQIVETTGNALWVSSLSFLEASSPGTGGFIETPNQRLGIWHVLPISSPAELARVPVIRTALTLGEVTTIVEDHQPLIGDALVNESANLMLVIEKLPGTNTLEVTKGVEGALAALQPGFTEINFDATLFRPANFIESAIANLGRALVLGALLAVLVLGVLFYGWRSALISSIVIALSLVSALLVLYLRRATLNSTLLAGLIVALGIIIDESIVDIEHGMHRLRQNHALGSPQTNKSVILEAVAEIRQSLFFATLIALLAILPVFFISDIPGALFQPLAISYILAVLAAMLSALTVTPILSILLFSSGHLENRMPPLGKWLQRGYRQILLSTIKKPLWVYVIMIVLVIGGLAVLPSLLRQNNLLPVFRESNISIRLESAPATSRAEMDRIVSRMSGELRTIPGVKNVGAHIGRAVLGDEVVDINSAEVWVSLEQAARYNTTVAAIRETAEGYPGLSSQVSTNIQQSLNQPDPTRTEALYTVRIFGDDHDILVAEAEGVRQSVAAVSGVAASHALLPVVEPTINIEVDLAAAQRYGIKPGDVRRAVATLLSGIQVGSLFEEQKVFDVVVWSPPDIRGSITDVLALLIDTPGGGHVRLGEVADVNLAASPVVIRREAISPYVDIGFDIRGRSVNAVLRDVRAAMHNYAFPQDYHAEVIDSSASERTAQQNILVVGLLTLVGIFLLLQAACRNWPLTGVTILTLPVALSGGILTAFLNKSDFSLSALFGLLTVIGIAFRNSITMINHYYHLETREGETFGPELVLRGAVDKLVPILMTAITTSLFLLPIVVMGRLPGLEIMRTISIIIMGGLVTSTLFGLFVLPLLYLRVDRLREPDLGLQPSTETDVSVDTAN